MDVKDQIREFIDDEDMLKVFDQKKADIFSNRFQSIFVTFIEVSFGIERVLNKKIIPNSWRLDIFRRIANISHIFKKVHRTVRTIYRPISLTSIISIMEKRLVTRADHGFFQSKSCLSNLFVTLDFIMSSILERNSVD